MGNDGLETVTMSLRNGELGSGRGKKWGPWGKLGLAGGAEQLPGWSYTILGVDRVW